MLQVIKCNECKCTFVRDNVHQQICEDCIFESEVLQDESGYLAEHFTEYHDRIFNGWNPGEDGDIWDDMPQDMYEHARKAVLSLQQMLEDGEVDDLPF